MIPVLFLFLLEKIVAPYTVRLSALYGVNRAFKTEATKLLRDYVAVIALALEQSRVRGEIRVIDVESTALMILTLTESYVLSAGVLGQSESEINKKAEDVADLVLHGIGIETS